ncbi:MAG TPA: lysylphosphatidylglycerol synthase transmembrane domain-containing protein [Flavobacteriaceae bacterium]|nr:lysylphosphatidylglycerol synthase transmembrane domain-containing protein [Flavobacteriaceae bacterium]
MKTNTRKGLQLAIPIFLALFLGWYAFSKVPFNDLIPYFKSANYFWIAVSIFCGILSHISRAYRWNYLLQPLGHQIKLPNSIMAVFAAYLSNYGIPRSGEVLRAAVVSNYEAVPFEKAFGTIVAERVADMLVMLGIIFMTLMLQFEYIITLLKQSVEPKRVTYLSIVLLAVFLLFVLYLKRSKSPVSSKIKSFLKGLIEGMLSIFKMKYKWAFIAHTLFIWGMYIVMFYVATFALPDLNGITLGMMLVAFIAATFTIALTNGGVVAYPLAVMAALALFGIPETPSFAFGWIMWSSQTLMIIVAGIASFLYLPIYNKKAYADIE